MSNEIINETKSVSGVKLLDLQVQRNADSRLRITLQSSPELWAFLRHESGQKINIGGVKCFRPKNDQLQGVRGYFIPDGNVFETEEGPNLNLLLAVDIDKGITFDFGQFPISESRMRDWIAKFKEQVKIIYLTYIKPIDVRVTFNTQTVESEFHD